MPDLESATKAARINPKRRTTWASSETYGQGKMKIGHAAKDMRINGRHMHDLSTPGVWRLQGDRRPSAANESWAAKLTHYVFTAYESTLILHLQWKMPSLAICSSNQLMPAPRPLSCQPKRSAVLDVVSFRTVVVPSTGVIPSPFPRQKQHESRSPNGTRVVVPPGALPCAAFILNQPSPRTASSGLSRSRAYACAVTSNSWPCVRGPSQSERLPATRSSCDSCTTSHHHTQISPVPGRTKNLGTPHHRAALSPRLTSVP